MGSRLNIKVAPDVPRVLADPSRLQLVFDNLLSNALKYTRIGGEVTIEAQLEDSMVRFAVEDTGIGIAPCSPAPCVSLEKFFRGAGAGAGRARGWGSPSPRRSWRPYGGAIEAASQPGPGHADSPLLVKAAPRTGLRLNSEPA